MKVGYYKIIYGSSNAYPRLKAFNGMAKLAGYSNIYCVLASSSDTISYVNIDTWQTSGGNSVSSFVDNKGYAFYYDGSATYFHYPQSTAVVQMKSTGSGTWSSSTIASGLSSTPIILDAIGDGECVYVVGSTVYIGTSYTYTLSSGDYAIGGYVGTDGSYHWAKVNGTTVTLLKNATSEGTITLGSTPTFVSQTQTLSHRFPNAVVIVADGKIYISDQYEISSKVTINDIIESIYVAGDHVWNVDGNGIESLIQKDFNPNYSPSDPVCIPKIRTTSVYGIGYTDKDTVIKCTIKEFDGTAVIEDGYSSLDDWKDKGYVYIADGDGNEVFEGYVDRVYHTDDYVVKVECSNRWAKEKNTDDGTLHYLDSSDVSPVEGEKFSHTIDAYCKKNGKFAHYKADENRLYVDDATDALATVDVDSGDTADKPTKKVVSTRIKKVVVYGKGKIVAEKETGVDKGSIVYDYFPSVESTSDLEDIADGIITSSEVMTIRVAVYNKGKIGYGGQVQYRDSNYGFTSLTTYYAVDCEYEVVSDTNVLYLRDALWYDPPTSSTIGKTTSDKNAALITSNVSTQTGLESLLSKGGYVDLKGAEIDITSTVTIGGNTTLANGVFHVKMTSGTVFYLQGVYARMVNCTITIDEVVPTSSWMYVIDVRNSRQTVNGNIIYNGADHAGNVVGIRMASLYQSVVNNVIADWTSDYLYAAIQTTTASHTLNIVGNSCVNGKYGIMLYGKRISCVGNSLYSHTTAGVWIYSATGYNTVVGNAIQAGGSSVKTYNSTHFTVVGNTLNGAVSLTGSNSSYKIAHNTNDSTHNT